MKNPASAAPDPEPGRTPRRRFWRTAPLLAVLALALAGCLGASGPPERLFRLSDPVPPAATARSTVTRGMMVVEGFEARGALARQRSIVYRDTARPNETQYYPSAQWEEPPAAMIQAALAGCLDRAGLFDGVVRRDRRLRPRYSLVGVLDRLEQQVAGSCSRAVIRVEMTVIDEEANRVLLKGAYQAAEPAGPGPVDQALPAFDRALTRICATLVGDLRRAGSGGKPEGGSGGKPEGGAAPGPAQTCVDTGSNLDMVK